jgi:DNA polymerase III alpha subunit
MKVIPLFTSAYSFRSILTVAPPEKTKEGGADSIIKIAKDRGIETVFLVEDNMASFLEAKKSCGDSINLAYGFRVTICSDATSSEEEVESTCSKYVIFAKNALGYKKLIEIATRASVDFSKKGEPRLDFKILKSLWDEKCLLLAVPFYSSFLHRNSCNFAECVPDFSFCNPVFFWEDNLLYLDSLIQDAINMFTNFGEKYEIVKSKTIFYKNREDFAAWQTYKCIQNRSTLEAPNLEHCASREFCVESWEEQNRA